jgi:hypothetical protein
MGSLCRSDARRAFHQRERAAVTFLARAALQYPHTFVIMSLLIARLGRGSITTIPPNIFQRSIFPCQHHHGQRVRGNARDVLPLGRCALFANRDGNRIGTRHEARPNRTSEARSFRRNCNA